MTVPNDEIVCKELVELVTPYLEDVLPANERAAIERHLAECDGCRTYVGQMRQTIRAIGHIPHEPITSQHPRRGPGDLPRLESGARLDL